MLKAYARMLGRLGLVAAYSVAAPVMGADTTTVCQLYARRSTPETKPVHIHATAWVALRHGGSLLQDADCPKAAIGFRFVDEARDRPMVKKLSDAMTGDVMNLKPRIFDVRLVGVFSGATTAEPNGLFLVEDVEGFEQRQ